MLKPASQAMRLCMTQNGTILIEGTGDANALRRRLEETSASEEVLLVCMVQHREVVESVANLFTRKVVSQEPGDHVARVLQNVNTERVAFLPERA